MKDLKLSARTKDFISEYSRKLHEAINTIDAEVFDRAVVAITNTHRGRGRIFVCGNGGSAAISDHFMCDHSKGVEADTCFIPSVQSLASNMSLITAIGNDISYDEIYSYQLSMFGQAADLLVAISSSGNSPNIIKALQTAKQNGIKTIAFVGFDGGQAKSLADIVFHIPVKNYGIVEDAHQALMHILAQYIRINNSVKVDIKL